MTGATETTEATELREADEDGRERLVAPGSASEDIAEASLRPQKLDEFIGQAAVRENLAVFIEAACGRGEALDHLLFFGPPGLGKTTLAQIVARELGVNFRTTSGPILAKQGDLAAVLTNLQPRDVLFIDEIHRLNPAVEEILYPAMEDFQLDLMIGEGPAARSIRIDLPPFYAYRSDNTIGPYRDSVARQIWHSTAIGVLQRGRAAARCRAGRARLRH